MRRSDTESSSSSRPHLLDGSTVPLQGVPPADLPRLQELRQRAGQS